MSGLVESLLALARTDAGATPAEPVDAGAAVRERVQAWIPLADERGVTLTFDLNGASMLWAGPQRLAQVLDNLVSNAIDHAPAGSAVTVSARQAAPWVEIRVRDAGPGMSEEERARAFDRFWRAPRSRHGGSGLGLTIVKRLVEADGGEVALTKAPGGGTEAVVRLRPA